MDVVATKTYGPVYKRKIDGPRIAQQMEEIKQLMLANDWLTLAEIERLTGHPQASISAQLRHLRKAKFGSYQVEKQRRTEGTWEYRVRKPKPAGLLFD